MGISRGRIVCIYLYLPVFACIYSVKGLDDGGCIPYKPAFLHDPTDLKGEAMVR